MHNRPRSTPSRCAVASDGIERAQLEWQQPTSEIEDALVDAEIFQRPAAGFFRADSPLLAGLRATFRAQGHSTLAGGKAKVAAQRVRLGSRTAIDDRGRVEIDGHINASHGSAQARHRADARVEVERFGQTPTSSGTLISLLASSCQATAPAAAARAGAMRPAKVGDLDRLDGLDSAQQLAGPPPTEVIVQLWYAVENMGRRSTHAGFK